MIDPRNRPALIASALAGVAAFVLLWFLGLSPLLAWIAGWTLPAFAMYGIDKRQAEQGGWRVPEVLLHGLALVCGAKAVLSALDVCGLDTDEAIDTIAWAARSLVHQSLAD